MTINQTARLDPIRLEEMAGSAAILHSDRGIVLSKAVYLVTKNEKITTEHLKRILRAANVRAYLMAYDRADASNRVINFEGGPASFEDIMSMMEKQEESMSIEDPLGDYKNPPTDYKSKRIVDSMEVNEKVAEEKIDPSEIYFKLKTAEDRLNGENIQLFGMGDTLQREFDTLIKQAVMSDYTLGDIVKVASLGEESPILPNIVVKIAKGMPDKFWTDEEIAESLEKSSAMTPDPENPIRQKWLQYTECVKQAATNARTLEYMGKKKDEVLTVIRKGLNK